MNLPRASGLLLHPTSLPGPFGIGDLGPAAYAFADFLVAAGQKYWQVLPLGPTGYGDSPYQSFSAFAGNTNLISPELLRANGLLTEQDLSEYPALSPDSVDFGAVIKVKADLLGQAFATFQVNIENPFKSEFERFCESDAHWLSDYALFRALKDSAGGAAWTDWGDELVQREPAKLADAAARLSAEIAAHKFCQFLFYQQWFALKSYCNERGLRIIGDIPLFVAQDSVDVWRDPGQFKLNADGRPRIVAGVPPDYFSETGQLWGNPMYDWERMEVDGFRWWIARVRHTLKLYDVVRLDHFRGFAACWEVPANETTAVNGVWVNVLGRELLEAATKSLGELPLIAEDLGVITPDVEALRDDFGYPGMRVLQFGFGSDAKNEHLPHNYIRNLVAYTGTHDNDTAVGWFKQVCSVPLAGDDSPIDSACDRARRYLNTDGSAINWDLIRATWASVADTAIAPLQDVLGTDGHTRMNLPASDSGNWAWRFRDGDLTDELAERLRTMTGVYGRSDNS